MSSTKWAELGINEVLSSALVKQGIVEPTEVQQQAIQLLIEGKDISVKSQTGSGKTLAFLLPILQNINVESKSIQAVVLAPTQELAMQIVRVAESYGELLGVRVQQLIGGAAAKRQIEKLKLNPHIVIGTPGRMNELVKSKRLKLHQVKYLVIDEADQTFELGTPTDTENLLFNVNKLRQTAFFSATYPETTMSRYEGRWMKQPHHIMITPAEKVASTIEHFYVVCDQRSKLDTARRLLRTLNASSALLFVNDTNQISNWETKMKYEGFKIESLFGEADKQRRSATLTAFREGKLDAILSTDVAARGIDIVDLPLVIQIEPAVDADHYVHRAGRTGRMGKSGLVISIITPHEKFIMDKFMKQLHINIEERILFRGKLLNEAQVAEATKYKPAEKSISRKPVEVSDRLQSSSSKGKQAESIKSTPVQGSSIANINSGAIKAQEIYRSGEERQISTSNNSDSSNNGSVKKDKKTGPIAKATSKKKANGGKNKGAPKWLKEKRQTTDN